MLNIIKNIYTKKTLLIVIILQMIGIIVLWYLLRIEKLVNNQELVNTQEIESKEYNEIAQESEEEKVEKINNTNNDLELYHKYTVKDGDTIDMIADEYSISLGCIASANDLNTSHIIKPGQVLYIPVIDENVRIFDGNDLVYNNCLLNVTPESSQASKLVDPSKIKPFLQLPFDEESWGISQCWQSYHNGIDFVIPNRRVLSAAEGKVIYAGHRERYQRFGKIVIIEHSNQMYTGYFNLNKLYVIETEEVKQGELIGEISDSKTANLHFTLSRDYNLTNDVNPSFFFSDGIDGGCFIGSGITYEEYLENYNYH